MARLTLQTESAHQCVGAVFVGHEEDLLGLERSNSFTRKWLVSIWERRQVCLQCEVEGRLRYSLNNIFQHVFDVLLGGMQACDSVAVSSLLVKCAIY